MSMENFFNWMSKPIPKEEVIIWFNVHNMNYEKIELCGDIFRSCIELIDKVLKDSKLDKSQVNEIVLVGGTSRIPKLQKML
jgi:molecular chaperone DnaK (HSP70)